jgi:acetyl esterase
MNVDPELKILEQMVMPSFGDVVGVRAWLRAMGEAAPPPDSKASAGLTIDDRYIPGPKGAPEIQVRVYRPQSGAAIGAMVYAHSGSTIMGDLETDHWACLRYAREAGVAVVSVNYRLAPENRFPAAVEDCYAALQWTDQNIADLGAPAGQLAVGGSSSGGTIAGGLALMARDRAGPKPLFQMLIYAAFDDQMQAPSMQQFVHGHFLTRHTVGQMWRHYLGAPGVAASPYAAPTRATDLSNLAPAYIEAGALDPLRDEAVDYSKRLWQADVAAELVVYPGAPHAYDVVPGAGITERAFASRVSALKRAFG